MLTLKIQEEAGKNTSKCRRWFTKVDAYVLKNSYLLKGQNPHTLHTNKLDKLETQGQLEFEQSVRLLKLVCTTDWSYGHQGKVKW